MFGLPGIGQAEKTQGVIDRDRFAGSQGRVDPSGGHGVVQGESEVPGQQFHGRGLGRVRGRGHDRHRADQAAYGPGQVIGAAQMSRKQAYGEQPRVVTTTTAGSTALPRRCGAMTRTAMPQRTGKYAPVAGEGFRPQAAPGPQNACRAGTCRAVREVQDPAQGVASRAPSRAPVGDGIHGHGGRFGHDGRSLADWGVVEQGKNASGGQRAREEFIRLGGKDVTASCR